MIQFVVLAHPVGQVESNRGKSRKKGQSVEVRRYWRYCARVRMFFAEETDVDAEDLPLLVATKKDPWYIYTDAYFVGGTHPDPENVHKGIKDALFYKAPNGDKYTGGTYEAPLYTKDNPRVEVTLKRRHER